MFWRVIPEVRDFPSSRLRNPELAFFLFLGFGNFVLPVLVFLRSGVQAFWRSGGHPFLVSVSAYPLALQLPI